ncbi:MAG: RCC1 domain-containing protein, partial [Verrucomicrobiota bacterium]
PISLPNPSTFFVNGFMRFGLFLILSTFFTCTLQGQNVEPSEFRVFTDKRDQTIEARILSLSDDLSTMRLERTDGNIFETPITVLSLDDQQFIRDWMNPSPSFAFGELAAFGLLAKQSPPDMEPARGVKEFTKVEAMKSGWMALLPSGKVVSSDPKINELEDIADIYCNTVWTAITNREGQVLNGRLDEQHPEELGFAVASVAGANHMAAILKNGDVKVWGRGYETESVTDPPGSLPPIVALATTQSGVSAIDESGAIHRWNPDWDEVKTFRPDGGIVQVEGSIFNFLGLTGSGELFEWRGDPSDGSAPKVAEGEGPFVKIHCNGNTRAAQRLDGTWFAWGTNGAGIVDKIKALPPTAEITFFSEPSKENHGHLLYTKEDS